MRYSNDPSGLKRSLAEARAEIERLTAERNEAAMLLSLHMKRAEKSEAKRDEARAQVAAALAHPPQPSVSVAGATETPRAWLDVLGERVRQITAEGWTADHDDAHSLGQMAGAALCYLAEDIPHWARQQAHGCYWPWDAGWWKPGDHRRNLVKAGALILAEIERLDRATTESSHGE